MKLYISHRFKKLWLGNPNINIYVKARIWFQIHISSLLPQTNEHAKKMCEFLSDLKFFAFLGKCRDQLLIAHLWLLWLMLIYYKPGLIIVIYLKTTYAKELPVWKHLCGLGEIEIRNRFQDKQEHSPVLFYIWNRKPAKMETTLVLRLKKDMILNFFYFLYILCISPWTVVSWMYSYLQTLQVVNIKNVRFLFMSIISW